MLRRGWERFKQRFSLLKVGKDFEPYLPSVEGWSDPSKPAYRYPAPASQFQPVPPTPEELRFDTAYYKRQNVDARVTYMGKKSRTSSTSELDECCRGHGRHEVLQQRDWTTIVWLAS